MTQQAIDYFNHANSIRGTDPQTAYRLYVAATQLNPNFTEAWRELGNHLGDNNLTEAALACYRQALHCNPGDLGSLMSAGYRTFQSGEYDLAKKFMSRALLIDPQCVYAYANLSLIYSAQGNHEKAIYLAKQAYDLANATCLEDKNELLKMLSLTQDMDITDRIYATPILGEDIVKVEIALAFAYLHASMYAEGLKLFESRIPYKYPRYNSYPYPRWNGTDSLAGKTILIESDGGIGDTLSYFRFLCDKRFAEAEKILLVLPPTLLRFAGKILKKMGLNESNVQILPLPNQFPVADMWVPMLSLPVILNWSTQQIDKSRFFALPHELLDWNEIDNSFLVPNKLLHVGISWAGNKENDIDKWRSFPVNHFLGLSKCPGVQLYSMQVGERAGELYTSGASAFIRDLAPYITDVVDTIKLAMHMDIIVCAESAMCHIAGMIDKPCIVPYSYCGRDWRIGNADKPNIWYPQQISIRQDTRKTWEPVFKQIEDKLNSMTAHRRNATEVI